ncbi:hypothetical protein [Saccharicrinis sp. 156]|uniref:hypothetical protein n=1 Tax=Saccharicrinis sp. 156 TaxID=3417574 RepID=UPI003D338A33
MKYFLGFTDIEQAKQHYRKLAKRLHPDKGGTAHEFQKMQHEYKYVVEHLLQYNHPINSHAKCKKTSKRKTIKSELFEVLRQTAKELIKEEVPQSFLKEKIQKTTSQQEKGLLIDILKLINIYR